MFKILIINQCQCEVLNVERYFFRKQMHIRKQHVPQVNVGLINRCVLHFTNWHAASLATASEGMTEAQRDRDAYIKNTALSS
jgi:hypothetical protein